MKKRKRKLVDQKLKPASYDPILKKKVLIYGHKHSQVTIFVIVAILIIALILIFIIFSSIGLDKKDEPANPETDPIYSYTKSCIEKIGKNAILSNSLRGGYFSPGLATEGNTPYYYDKGKYYVPTRDDLQKELNLYMNFNLYSCDFSGFNSFEIKIGSINTSSKILDDKVIYNVIYPLEIKKAEKTYSLKNFQNIIIPARIGIINTAVTDFFNETKAHEGGICMTCLYDIGEKYDLNFELYNYDNETVLFVVRDKKSIIYNDSLQFDFAAKYPLYQHLMDSRNIK